MSWWQHRNLVPRVTRQRTASQALAVCANCPVIDPCQTFSMMRRNADEVEIWGGVTECQSRRGRAEQLT
jgi:hypothetical protein